MSRRNSGGYDSSGTYSSDGSSWTSCCGRSASSTVNCGNFAISLPSGCDSSVATGSASSSWISISARSGCRATHIGRGRESTAAARNSGTSKTHSSGGTARTRDGRSVEACKAGGSLWPWQASDCLFRVISPPTCSLNVSTVGGEIK